MLAGDLEGTIGRLLELREPVYSTVRLQVDTTCLAPQQVAEQVLVIYHDAAESSVQTGTMR
jgi:hypothetical protein